MSGARRWSAVAASACGLLLAVCACALLLAGCGSSGGPSSAQNATGATQAASMVKFSECMRSHGVSGFPDPSTSASGENGFGIDAYEFNLPPGVNTQSPAYEAADKVCQNGIPGNSGGSGPSRSPAFVARAKQAALAHARCMRAHGVPNFPDPNVSSSGGGVTVGSGGAGLDPRSPAFQQAQKACQPPA